MCRIVIEQSHHGDTICGAFGTLRAKPVEPVMRQSLFQNVSQVTLAVGRKPRDEQ